MKQETIKLISSRTNAPLPDGWSIDAVHLSVHFSDGKQATGYGFEIGLENYVRDRIRSALNAKGE